MSYLVLARKYRPLTFEDVVEQSHVTKTLENAIKSNRVAHAILFSGPRGTGKTTIARILAKALNCYSGPISKPCNQCKSCLEITAGNAVDVFEIDGASNNGVEQIRELRENIKYMPAHCRFKIYIIDEVHMLSPAAFNALLKTLEEPPAHVLFMFATTEPNKIPITILSRCQRHDLRRINLNEITAHMQTLCEKESIAVERETLFMIARESGGSMRDALSLLDQIMVCSEDFVSHEQVLHILGVVDRKYVYDLTNALLQGNLAESLDLLNQLHVRGYNLKKLIAELIDHFRNLLIVKIGKHIDRLVDLPDHEIPLMKEQVQPCSAIYLNQIFELLFQEESLIRYTSQPKMALEMIFFKIIHIKPAFSLDQLIQKIDSLRKELEKSGARPFIPSSDHKINQGTRENIDNEIKDNTQPSSPKPKHSKKTVHTETALETEQPKELILDQTQLWEKVKTQIKIQIPSIFASLSNASMTWDQKNSVQITVNGAEFTFNMIHNRKEDIQGIISQLTQRKTKLHIIAGEIKGADIEQRKIEQERINQITMDARSHPLITKAVKLFKGEIYDVKLIS